MRKILKYMFYKFVLGCMSASFLYEFIDYLLNLNYGDVRIIGISIAMICIGFIHDLISKTITTLADLK